MTIYSIALLVALVALSSWFLSEKKQQANLLSFLSIVSLLVMMLSWYATDGPLGFKLGFLSRDLLFLAIVPTLVRLIGRNVPKLFSFLLVFGSAFIYFSKILGHTFDYAYDEHFELLVELSEGRTLADIDPILAEYSLKTRPAFTVGNADATDLDDYYLVDIPTIFESHLGEISFAFNNSGLVDWIEENDLVNIEPLEFDTPQRRSPVTAVNDPGYAQQWGLQMIDFAAYRKLLGNSNLKPRKKVRLAILDTGIDAEHEDIAPHYYSTKKEYDDDPKMHGTHCAGIAASVTNNGKGVASLVPNGNFVEVTSIKVLNQYGMGTQRTIIQGIIDATDGGADVISMSLGGRSNDSKQRAYEKAIEYANKKGVIVLAAAGNNGFNANQIAPANVEGLITVSAIDTLGNRASFSNYVSDLKMGIAAPGTQIYSTVPGNDYKAFNGTSMATPLVAGLVAVLKSMRPEMTTREVYELLNATGKNTQNTTETGKLIQPAAALGGLLDVE